MISVAPRSRLVLGDGVCLASATRANPLACFQPCVLRTLAPDAELILGPKVGISGTVLCAGLRIIIGEGSIFGSGAMVIDNDFHSPEGQWGWKVEYRANARPIVIGRGCFIGARAIIMKGVTLGDRVIVGAGSIVTRDVPDGHIAVGNPARIIAPKHASPAAKLNEQRQ
jgi:acetyltransferase-like isoleucine patch superfamily enzyme